MTDRSHTATHALRSDSDMTPKALEWDPNTFLGRKIDPGRMGTQYGVLGCFRRGLVTPTAHPKDPKTVKLSKSPW